MFNVTVSPPSIFLQGRVNCSGLRWSLPLYEMSLGCVLSVISLGCPTGWYHEILFCSLAWPSLQKLLRCWWLYTRHGLDALKDKCGTLLRSLLFHAHLLLNRRIFQNELEVWAIELIGYLSVMWGTNAPKYYGETNVQKSPCRVESGDDMGQRNTGFSAGRVLHPWVNQCNVFNLQHT